MAAPSRRAEPPRIPPPPARSADSQADQLRRTHAAESRERRSMARGLILLALLVLFFSILRAGLDRVFPPHWWRP